jgi:tetratricopeptide (TPR) repeat protein
MIGTVLRAGRLARIGRHIEAQRWRVPALLVTAVLSVASTSAAEGAVSARDRVHCLGDTTVWAELRRSACDRLLATPTLEDAERARAHHNRGDAKLTLGDLEGAVEDYTRTLDLDSNHAEALHHRCWVRALLGRELAQALADCNEAARLRPGDAKIVSARALTLLKMKRFQDAIAGYDDALKLEPDDADRLYARGIAKQRAGHREDAASDIAAAQAIDPDVAVNFERIEKVSDKSFGERLIEIWRAILKEIY